MTPQPPDSSAAPRILILRLSALGDILHALPLLGALRGRWPRAHLGWLVQNAGAPLLEGHPMLNRLHIFPKQAWKQNKWRALRGPLRALREELRAERYDIALDVQGLTKSAAWGWLAGAPRRIGFAPPDARELAPWLATERVAPPPGARHILERNYSLLAPLGIAPPAVIKTPVHLPAAAQARAGLAAGQSGAPLMLLALGAGWPTKIWPPERFAELALRWAARGARVGLAWGPGEEPLALAVFATLRLKKPDFGEKNLPPGPGIYVLPRLSFVELGATIARAKLFVGGDTGPTHFAAALGVPTVSMMGPLDARRNGPYGPQCVTVQHAIPRPAPWWRNHRRWCDPATALDKISVDEIDNECLRLWEQTG